MRYDKLVIVTALMCLLAVLWECGGAKKSPTVGTGAGNCIGGNGQAQVGCNNSPPATVAPPTPTPQPLPTSTWPAPAAFCAACPDNIFLFGTQYEAGSVTTGDSTKMPAGIGGIAKVNNAHWPDAMTYMFNPQIWFSAGKFNPAPSTGGGFTQQFGNEVAYFQWHEQDFQHDGDPGLTECGPYGGPNSTSWLTCYWIPDVRGPQSYNVYWAQGNTDTNAVNDTLVPNGGTATCPGTPSQCVLAIATSDGTHALVNGDTYGIYVDSVFTNNTLASQGTGTYLSVVGGVPTASATVCTLTFQTGTRPTWITNYAYVSVDTAGNNEVLQVETVSGNTATMTTTCAHTHSAGATISAELPYTAMDNLDGNTCPTSGTENCGEPTAEPADPSTSMPNTTGPLLGNRLTMTANPLGITAPGGTAATLGSLSTPAWSGFDVVTLPNPRPTYPAATPAPNTSIALTVYVTEASNAQVTPVPEIIYKPGNGSTAWSAPSVTCTDQRLGIHIPYDDTWSCTGATYTTQAYGGSPVFKICQTFNTNCTDVLSLNVNNRMSMPAGAFDYNTNWFQGCNPQDQQDHINAVASNWFGPSNGSGSNIPSYPTTSSPSQVEFAELENSYFAVPSEVFHAQDPGVPTDALLTWCSYQVSGPQLAAKVNTLATTVGIPKFVAMISMGNGDSSYDHLNAITGGVKAFEYDSDWYSGANGAGGTYYCNTAFCTGNLPIIRFIGTTAGWLNEMADPEYDAYYGISNEGFPQEVGSGGNAAVTFDEFTAVSYYAYVNFLFGIGPSSSFADRIAFGVKPTHLYDYEYIPIGKPTLTPSTLGPQDQCWAAANCDFRSATCPTLGSCGLWNGTDQMFERTFAQGEVFVCPPQTGDASSSGGHANTACNAVTLGGTYYLIVPPTMSLDTGGATIATTCTACNTATTGERTVTLADMTGISANTYLLFDYGPGAASPDGQGGGANMEEIQVESCTNCNAAGSGTVKAWFSQHHANNIHVTGGAAYQYVAITTLSALAAGQAAVIVNAQY